MSSVFQIAYVTVDCPSCGVQSGVPEDFVVRRRRDGKTFFCLNGHSMSYGQSEADRLRDEKVRLQQQLDQRTADRDMWRGSAEHSERRLRSTKGVVTRMKRRIIVGQCVCCSRKFKDLEKHMKAEHPDWNPDRAAEALTEKALK